MNMSQTFTRLWRIPITVALLSASGLLSALVSDGWGDAWSWLALGLPVALIAWYGWLSQPQPQPKPHPQPNTHAPARTTQSPPPLVDEPF